MMANPHRAEIELEALGERFKLRLDTDAICNAEADLDMGFGDMLSRVLSGKANVRVARAIICAASAGRIDRSKANAILEMPGLITVWPQIVRLVALCLPPAEGGAENPPAAAPGGDPDAANGTGGNS